MAHILPAVPPTFLTPAVLKTFTALKRLPDSYHVWHHLAPWTPDAPDFLVIGPDQRALLVIVSAADPAAAHPAAQLLLMDEEHPGLGEAEAAVLADFLQALDLPAGAEIGALVVFPRIPHTALTHSRPARPPGEPHWAGAEILADQDDALPQETLHKEPLRKEPLRQEPLTWDSFMPEAALDEMSLAILRRRFTPESVVPPNLTTRQPEKTAAGLTDFLLDYDQEAALKADLELDTQGAQLTDDFQLNIINGVAGSGKTLILLYRLRLLHHLYPASAFWS